MAIERSSQKLTVLGWVLEQARYALDVLAHVVNHSFFTCHFPQRYLALLSTQNKVLVRTGVKNTINGLFRLTDFLKFVHKSWHSLFGKLKEADVTVSPYSQQVVLNQ